MITDIDPYFSSRSDFSAQTTTHTAASHPRALRSRLGALNPRRAERDSSFEQVYGSLWQPGLLDRLSSPLTRYHE
jgi:hypothetical protein